jgi:adenylate cyclase
MRFSVGQKVFSITAVILVLMAIVSVISVRFMSDLRRDLHTIATVQAPAADFIARINVHVLRQGVLLDRLLALTEAGVATDSDPFLEEFHSLNREITREFEKAKALLAREARSETALTHVVRMLATNLDQIETQIGEFNRHGLNLLQMHGAGKTDRFRAAFPRLVDLQDIFDQRLGDLRRSLNGLAEDAVARAQRDDQRLLILNAALTVFAAVLGLAFSFLVTTRLVAAVRHLLQGTRAVEAGQLDVSLEKRSNDEVGELTLSFNSMVDGLRLKERIKETFGKYMDPRIVAHLVTNPEVVERGGERREMTVMFIDLKGFTAITENLGPDSVVRLVNLFFGHMTDAVSHHHGVIDKFMGDAVMAYWGPPFVAAQDHARLACRAALEAVERLEAFRDDVAHHFGDEADGLDIDLRIGVATGPVVVGNVGSHAARGFTVMGDPVNLGARLESINKTYGTRILVSGRTRDLAGEEFTSREIDTIRVLGKARPTRVFELLDPAAADPAPFIEAVAAYRRRDWDAAEAAFGRCRAEAPDDRAALVYLERIAHLREEAPPADWDGVWTFDAK